MHLIHARQIDVPDRRVGRPTRITPPRRAVGHAGSPGSDSVRDEKRNTTMHDTRREPPATRNAHALLRALSVAILLATTPAACQARRRRVMTTATASARA